VISSVIPSGEAAVPGFVNVIAHEEDPTSENWDVAAIAIYANTG
jgi:hypothetical protein